MLLVPWLPGTYDINPGRRNDSTGRTSDHDGNEDVEGEDDHDQEGEGIREEQDMNPSMEVISLGAIHSILAFHTPLLTLYLH